MRPAVLRGTVAATLLTAALVLAPQPAFAHGVHATGDTVSSFFYSGFVHMLLGWDHLLFVVGVALLSRRPILAVEFISLFSLGHSTTLILATLAGWRVNAVAVDVVIALSVVFVGAVGWFVRDRDNRWFPRWFGAAVLGFGLVHGLGLSTRLQDVGLPETGVLARVIAFNLGVEVGQLAALVGLAIIGILIYRSGALTSVPRPAFLGVITAGVLAVALVATLAVVAPPGRTIGSCQVQPTTEVANASGNHPPKSFYEPTEAIPKQDFGHVLGDRFSLVRYHPSLPTAQLDELRALVQNPAAGRLVGGSSPEQREAVIVVNLDETLVCDRYDFAAVTEFTRAWFLAELTFDPSAPTP